VLLSQKQGGAAGGGEFQLYPRVGGGGGGDPLPHPPRSVVEWFLKLQSTVPENTI
jgi:hypothetical protein